MQALVSGERLSVRFSGCSGSKGPLSLRRGFLVCWYIPFLPHGTDEATASSVLCFPAFISRSVSSRHRKATASGRSPKGLCRAGTPRPRKKDSRQRQGTRGGAWHHLLRDPVFRYCVVTTQSLKTGEITDSWDLSGLGLSMTPRTTGGNSTVCCRIE